MHKRVRRVPIGAAADAAICARSIKATEEHGLDSVDTYENSGAARLSVRSAWPAAGTASAEAPRSRLGLGGLVRTVPWPGLVVAVVALGLAIRLFAALHLTPHVDEAASLLAATMVVERGLPILPSGTVYFQGATLSYLMAPFVAFGADTLGDLGRLRLLCVLAGTAGIPLAYGLTRAVGGGHRAGTFAAVLVALDPVAVQWSAHLRMYALLQPLALAFAWLVVRVAKEGVTGRRLLGLIALAWALTFTHVAGLALWPGAALAVAWTHRRSSLGVWLRLIAAGIACALAPLTLLTLNRTLGSASVSNGEAPSGATPSFVGDHLLAMPEPLTRAPRLQSLGDLVAVIPTPTTLAWLVPLLVLLAVALTATARVLRPAAWGGIAPETRDRLAILLAIGWLPVAANWLGSAEPRARYVVHVHAIGWVLLAILAGGALARVAARLRGATSRLRWRDAVLVLLGPLVLVAGLGWRLAHPVVHPDYGTAMAYVAERRAPDQPILVALPTAGALTPGAGEGLVFLAGPADRPRAERLTRLSADGGLTDYWIGVPAITSIGDLNRFLAVNPDAWIVVDEERLNADWAYAGPIADALRGETRLVYEGPGRVLVLRPWAADAALPSDTRAHSPQQ